MSSQPFTLRLPEEAREDLKFLSTSTKRPQSAIASEILVQEVAAQASRARAIQAALKEARQGAFISQEAMERWVDSLGTDNELPMPEPDVFSD